MDGGPTLTFEGSVQVGVLVNRESDTMCVFTSELQSCSAREEEWDLTVSSYLLGKFR